MICPKCDTLVSGNFCPNCGEKVGRSSKSPQAPVSTYDDWDDEDEDFDTRTTSSSNGQPIIINNYTSSTENSMSYLRRGTALLLCLFFGWLGAHRFYVGKVGTGILWLITLGFFGIGILVDFISICCGSFRDHNGKSLVIW